jgi:hypothetical protein
MQPLRHRDAEENAEKAGLTNHVWEIEELVALLN